MKNNLKEKSKKGIQGLVFKFKKHQTYYVSKDYKEAEVRLSFIDGFFRYLGWDVDSKEVKNPVERDVIIEKSVDNELNKKFVDYTFRIDGKTQFLVEAKKPSESLSNKEHIFQAKSYAFSVGIPFVILTNFNEFRLFHITVKPLLNQPDTDLVKNFNLKFGEYEKTFDLLWDTFYKENVRNQSLVRLYLNLRRSVNKQEAIGDLNFASIKGSSLLNKEFLDDLLKWRKRLAEDVFKNNSSLAAQEINEIVQRTLDRIIFLRILEDRGIETEELLREALWKLKNRKITNLKDYLELLYSKLNVKYNGLLFHTHELSRRVKVSDDVLQYIISNLYYPNSPYNFKEISIEILGSIFEQYLGITISVNRNKIKLELKAELKKAGGAYYTPQEIVDEIVRNTIGSSLSRSNIEKYKIIDIACGSGSFLISAYKLLIKSYENYYSTSLVDLNKAFKAGKIFRGNNGIHLTISLKKRILEQNIYGVDIDPQAVEVTKMSLYLTMLEGKNNYNSPPPILPDLKGNIKCGNSIIDTDYLINYKNDSGVYPFNWKANFGNIIKNGFDCVIGNPPYIRIQIFEAIYSPLIKKYINNKYASSNYGNFDISVVFVEKALSLLKQNGTFGFIVPNKFMTSEYGEGLRGIISSGKYLNKLVHFTDQQVFSGPTTYTCLLFLRKEPLNQYEFMKVVDVEKWKQGKRDNFITMSSKELSIEPWYFSTDNLKSLENKLSKSCEPLVKVCERIYVGLQTDCDEVFLLDEVSRNKNVIYCKSDYTGKIHPFESEHLKKVLKGSKDINRYAFRKNRRLIFPYELGSRRPPLIDESIYKVKYPLTWSYLELCKKRLRRRGKGKLTNKDWYGYIYKKNHSRFECPKIVTSSLCEKSRFAFDKNGDYYFVGSGIGGGGGYGIVLKESRDLPYSYLNLLGILNSSLISYIILKKASPFSGGWVGIDKHFIDHILIPKVEAKDIDKLKLLKEIEKNVTLLLSVLEKNEKSSDLVEMDRGNILISNLNFEIDELVFELFELNKNEKAGIVDYFKLNQISMMK